jgi:hypothetical protein
MRINDPFNQLAGGYKKGETNQPLLRHIGLALEHQRHVQITSFTFSEDQEHFVLDHLKHTNPEVFKKIIKDTSRA